MPGLLIAVAVPEGLVIATDSRIIGSLPPGPPRVLTDNADKLFQISKYVAIGNIQWPYVGKSTINNLMLQASMDLQENSTLEAVADKVQTHLTIALQEATANNGTGSSSETEEKRREEAGVSLVMAGYSADRRGKILDFSMKNPNMPPLIKQGHSTVNPGAHWYGETGAIFRLLKGFDPLVLPCIPKEVQKTLLGCEYEIPWKLMSLKDAIDFTRVLVQLTLDIQQFSHGTRNWPEGKGRPIPSVGGPIDLAVITPGGLEWVSKKSFRDGGKIGVSGEG